MNLFRTLRLLLLCLALLPDSQAAAVDMYPQLYATFPADSAELGERFLQLPPLSAGHMAEEFKSRVLSYQQQITQEASGANHRLEEVSAKTRQVVGGALEREHLSLTELRRASPLSPQVAPVNSALADGSMPLLRGRLFVVRRMAAKAGAMLALPAVRGHLDARAADFLKEQLRTGESLASVAVQRRSALLSRAAYDLVKSVHDFTFGLATGVYDGFYDLGSAVQAVITRPGILSKIANDVMLTLTDPGPALNAFLDGIVRLSVTLARGSAEEKGRALGQLATGVLIALATDGTLLSAELPASLAGLTSEPVASLLGGSLREAARKIPRLAAVETDISKAAQTLFGRSRIGPQYTRLSANLPINEEQLHNFLGTRVWEVTPQPGETFYRIGNGAGSWWVRERPASAVQARIDKAILPEWNDFGELSTLTIPAEGLGQFYEGLAGPQGGTFDARLGRGAPNIYVGGTGQVYIPKDILQSPAFRQAVSTVPFRDR